MWFLRKNRIQRAELESAKPKTIGFISTSKSVGLTHFTFMIYSYLRDFCRKRIVYITHDEAIMEFCRLSTDPDLQRDAFFGLSYREILTFRELEMDYILVDYGSRLSEFREEFLRNDIRFLMGSLSLWQREAFFDYLMYESEMVRNGMQICYHFGENKLSSRIGKRPCSRLKRIPDCENPFFLTRATVEELSSWDEIMEI